MRPLVYTFFYSLVWITILLKNGSLCDEEVEYFHIDKSDWMEPTSMFENETRGPDGESITLDQIPIGLEDCLDLKEKLAFMKKRVEISEKEVIVLRSRLKSCDYKASAFFKRITAKIVKKIDLLLLHSKSMEASSDFYLHIDFLPAEMVLLRTLGVVEAASNCSFVDNLDKLASQLIDSAYLSSRSSFWIENYTHVVGIIFTLCAGYVFIIREGYVDKVLLLIVLGTLWEWKRMYELEINKRSLKYANVPEECLLEIGWMRRLTSWVMNGIYSAFSFKVHTQQSVDSEGICTNYYVINPILDVNPIQALSHVVASLLFRPLVQLGDYSGRATTAFLAHIPPGYIPIILPSALFVVFLIVVGMFKYSVRVPFVRIAPVAHNVQRLPARDEKSPRLPSSQQIVAQTTDNVLTDHSSCSLNTIKDVRLFKRQRSI